MTRRWALSAALLVANMTAQGQEPPPEKFVCNDRFVTLSGITDINSGGVFAFISFPKEQIIGVILPFETHSDVPGARSLIRLEVMHGDATQRYLIDPDLYDRLIACLG